MKLKLTIILSIFCFALNSCENDEIEYQTVQIATAEYMTLKELRSSVKITSPVPIVESGKIYSFNNLILVSDVDKGVHIIDNSNPENPSQIAFIEIVASRDMEIKGNYLYVDSLMDLVVFDLSDINNIVEVSRLENVLQTYIPEPFLKEGFVDYAQSGASSDGIIVRWNITEKRLNNEEVAALENLKDIRRGGVVFDMAFASAESTGQGGSLARFKIVSDYLYAVDSHNINIFNISNLETPKVLQSVYAGFDIETIFNKGNQLFLGSMSGMYVYDITTPATPKFISEFQHGTACDPVVVDDNYAYITLRAGNNCGAFDSSLQIVDISDIYNLELVKSYDMDNPYGLGIKDDLLFICDGTSGLKVYDKSDIENLILLNTFENITAFDVIPLGNRLIMIGENTLYQYNYSDDGLDLLSEFSLN